jgi:hypothetical protein
MLIENIIRGEQCRVLTRGGGGWRAQLIPRDFLYNAISFFKMFVSLVIVFLFIFLIFIKLFLIFSNFFFFRGLELVS